MTQAELADQPGWGPDGQLLDASKITWYNDPDDPHPIQSVSGVQEGNVLIASLHLATIHSCQVESVNAHAQSVPLLVLDSQRPSLPRNSMRMEYLIVASSCLIMRKCLLNASDLPPMSRVAMPLILIQKMRLMRGLFLRVNAMTIHQIQATMISKLGTTRYGSFSHDFSTS